MNREKLKGYLFGILTALCWAISPIFIYQGIQELPSSIWGTTIGISVATIIYLAWYIWQKKWQELPRTNISDIRWQVIGGLTGGFGILSRNVALDTTQVAIVISLVQIAALFTLIFGRLILGKSQRERITPKLVFGVVTIIGGSMLIIFGRNF